METGLRYDDQGAIIPRKIINTFSCRYGDATVFSADFHESVSANPYIEFYIRATDSGPLEFIWEEDGGGVFRLEHHLAVG
jgi:sulfur-oxidizing protein SoxZ